MSQARWKDPSHLAARAVPLDPPTDPFEDAPPPPPSRFREDLLDAHRQRRHLRHASWPGRVAAVRSESDAHSRSPPGLVVGYKPHVRTRSTRVARRTLK